MEFWNSVALKRIDIFASFFSLEAKHERNFIVKTSIVVLHFLYIMHIYKVLEKKNSNDHCQKLTHCNSLH